MTTDCQRVQEHRSLSARSWARSQNSERSMNAGHFHFGDCKKIGAQYIHEWSLWVRSFFLLRKSMWLFFSLFCNSDDISSQIAGAARASYSSMLISRAVRHLGQWLSSFSHFLESVVVQWHGLHMLKFSTALQIKERYFDKKNCYQIELWHHPCQFNAKLLLLKNIWTMALLATLTFNRRIVNSVCCGVFHYYTQSL